MSLIQIALDLGNYQFEICNVGQFQSTRTTDLEDLWQYYFGHQASKYIVQEQTMPQDRALLTKLHFYNALGTKNGTPRLLIDHQSLGASKFPLPNVVLEEVPSDREPLRHLLIGSPKGVMSTIHNLYHLGYAEVGDWSPLLPTPNPREVRDLLTNKIPG